MTQGTPEINKNKLVKDFIELEAIQKKFQETLDTVFKERAVIVFEGDYITVHGYREPLGILFFGTRDKFFEFIKNYKSNESA